jgi:hypothetical protein
MHEHTLTSLYPGRAVEELVCDRPAQISVAASAASRPAGTRARRSARSVR